MIQTHGLPLTQSRRSALQRLLLVPLIRRIIKGDDLALRELLESRSPFRLANESPLTMVAFVAKLRETTWAWRLCGRDSLALDRAYDMTVSKFFVRPNRRTRDRRAGPDCRRHYRGFLSVMKQWQQAHPAADLLAEEAAAAMILQRYVQHHFRRSCLEASRSTSNPARSRYTWRLQGGHIVLYMPATLLGRQRGKWLQENIDDPDPTRPAERERIQAVIDAHLGVPRPIPWERVESSAGGSPLEGAVQTCPLGVVITADGLAKAVAKEKAENIHLQRPSIQALGRANLQRFVLQAFHSLREGCYEEKGLAERFRLSRPSVSRFAGTRWRMRSDTAPPDLWVNVAHVLAGQEDFVEAAQAAGVWPRVREIAALATARSQNGRPQHV